MNIHAGIGSAPARPPARALRLDVDAVVPQPDDPVRPSLAWERLQAHGVLTNAELLNDLRVHRSSAVCAVLARLPGVERLPGREISLRWTGAARARGAG